MFIICTDFLYFFSVRIPYFPSISIILFSKITLISQIHQLNKKYMIIPNFLIISIGKFTMLMKNKSDYIFLNV